MARRKELEAVEVQKAKYLAGFATSCTLTSGCKAAGIDNRTVYRWREIDDEFVFKENQLRSELADRLEAEAIRRAFEGFDRPIYQKGLLVGFERVYSDSLLKTMLAALRPEKFRENLSISGSVEQIVRQVAGFDAREVL